MSASEGTEEDCLATLLEAGMDLVQFEVNLGRLGQPIAWCAGVGRGDEMVLHRFGPTRDRALDAVTKGILAGEHKK